MVIGKLIKDYCEEAYIPVVRRGNCHSVTGQAGVLSQEMRLKKPKKG